jgi:integrase
MKKKPGPSSSRQLAIEPAEIARRLEISRASVYRLAPVHPLHRRPHNDPANDDAIRGVLAELRRVRRCLRVLAAMIAILLILAAEKVAAALPEIDFKRQGDDEPGRPEDMSGEDIFAM